MEQITVYTIGHSNRELSEFINLLKAYDVQVLIDVRRFPTSKKFPHFIRDKLRDVLEGEDIEYYWLGDLLGGFRPGGYRSYMKTNEFKRGIQRLMKIISRGKTTVIMCKEKLWFRCHRRFISDVLVEKGIKVVHIVDIGKTYIHPRYRFLYPSS
ncbi:MAG: DUF488 domain-containing protein [Thermoprotei archaeon]|nr:MAG: DUF488 domain-containing protein [Thermoprotei archaeon]